MEKQAGVARRKPVVFKSRGRYKGTKEVKSFGGGIWKTWLEFQQEINRLYIFLNMDDSTHSARGLREVISQLLHGRDLDQFMDDVEQAQIDGDRLSMRAMVTLTERPGVELLQLGCSLLVSGNHDEVVWAINPF